jgi:hypothetical protein
MAMNVTDKHLKWGMFNTMSWSQVTLFKRNYQHVVSDLYFKSYHTVARGNPNYFITYGNGKSAARVQPGLRPNGAHRWYSYTKSPKCGPKPVSTPSCISPKSALVLK